MKNFIRGLKMLDYDSERTKKTYIISLIWELLLSGIVCLITVKRYDAIKEIDETDEMDEERFEKETAEVVKKNTKLWCGAAILLWITGIYALFKMDYTTVGEWWDRHFKK